MPRASDLRLNPIKLAQDGRVLTATAVAPPLNFVTTEFIRDLDRLTAAVDTDDSVGLSGPLGSRPATASGRRGTECRRGARGPRRTRG
jgi:hypothetical protein